MYADIQQRILLMHTDLVERLDEIRSLLLRDIPDSIETTKPPQLPVEPYLAERFAANAIEIRAIDPFPLADGIDAVAFHFEESTRKFRSFAPLTLTPEPVQYLNLMKCIWIMEQIKSNPSFKVACKDILWKAYVRELEAKIVSETERFNVAENPLQIPGASDILREPESNFRVWVKFDEADPFPTLTEPDGFEHKIFEASLPNISSSRKQDLVVFRLDDTRIRIVRVVTSTISKDREVEGHEIEADKVHFVPFYAFPGNIQPALSIAWRATGSDQRTQALTFNHIGDIHRLQQAITNFGVVYDSLGITQVLVKSSGLRSVKTIGNNGRIQIWSHRQPPNPLEAPRSERKESASTGFASNDSDSGSGWARFIAVSVNPASDLQQAGQTALLRYPVLSRIVIFAASKSNGEASARFICIPLTEKTRLNPRHCNCSRPSNNCTRVIVESKKILDVEVYDSQGQDRDWNLAALRWPGHVDHSQNLELLKNIKFVALDFESVEQRTQFTKTFEMASQIIRDRVESYWRDRCGVRTQHVVR